jgi:YNFM family putative membrane transporter
LGDLVPDDRGTVAVLYQTFFYLGGALGTLLPVLAWGHGGYTGVIFLCLGLLGLALLPFTILSSKKP